MAPARNEEPTEHDTALDQHVVYFLRHHPEFYNQHTISKIQPGWYIIDGREITVEWHYGENGAEGYLVAVDGPLRQPFADYAQGTEANAVFDNKLLPRSCLQQIPKERQLSFGDMHQVVSRLEAMKIAKEQALVREMAAGYTKEGQAVPQSTLMKRYQKTIDTKLGTRNRRQTQPAPVAAPPPAASPPVPVPPRGVETPRGEPTTQVNKYGSPVYCPNHNATEKRKKIVPQKAECWSCKTIVQTNYAEFKMCPACSQRDNRCMCCGESATAGQRPKSHPTPLYCSNHSTTERRKKVAPQRVECSTCREVVQTNYAEFTVCHVCSQRDNRCVCCGDSVAGGQRKNQDQGQVTPTFCRNHNQTENREKTKPRNVECASCKVTIQTNYVDFTLCAPCSQAELRCVCCGSSTTMPSAAQLPSTAAGIGFPNLGLPQFQGWPMFSNQPMNNQIFASQNPLASQCAMAHNPMASQNPLASQNVFASVNPMASANHMMPQRAF